MSDVRAGGGVVGSIWATAIRGLTAERDRFSKRQEETLVRPAMEAGYTPIPFGWLTPDGRFLNTNKQVAAELAARGPSNAPTPAAPPPAATPTIAPPTWYTGPAPERVWRPGPDSWPAPVVPPPIVAGVPGMGLPTPPQPNPWEQRRAADRLAWDKFLKDSKRPTTRAKRRIKSAAEKQREQLLKIARQAAKRYPKLGKVVPVLARIPKGAGPTVAVTAAYQAGYWLGTKIYERLTAEAARTGPSAPSRAPVPRSPDASVPRSTASASLPPLLPVVVQRPSTNNPPGRRSRGTPPGGPVLSRSNRSSPIRVSTLDRKTIPAPRVVLPRAPVTARSVLTSPRTRAILKYTAPIAIGLLSGSDKRKRRRQSDISPGGNVAPLVAPLTQVQPYPLSSRLPSSPSQRTKQCECEKPKRKPTKKACRNPVTRRTKRERDGALYVTTTRRIQCQP